MTVTDSTLAKARVEKSYSLMDVSKRICISPRYIKSSCQNTKNMKKTAK